MKARSGAANDRDSRVFCRRVPGSQAPGSPGTVRVAQEATRPIPGKVPRPGKLNGSGPSSIPNEGRPTAVWEYAGNSWVGNHAGLRLSRFLGPICRQQHQIRASRAVPKMCNIDFVSIDVPLLDRPPFSAEHLAQNRAQRHS